MSCENPSLQLPSPALFAPVHFFSSQHGEIKSAEPGTSDWPPWKRVVGTRVITLIPAAAQMVAGRDGKWTGRRRCQLMPFKVADKIGDKETKSTLLTLSL